MKLIPLILSMFLPFHCLYAQMETDDDKRQLAQLAKTAVASYQKISVNNLSQEFYNNGYMGQLYYKNYHSFIYAEGILFGGYLNTNGTQELRIGGSLFISGLKGGKIITPGSSDNNFIPVADESSLPQNRVYRIRKDVSSITDESEKLLLQKDYNEWPINQGAPVNNDGSPKFVGDEVLFYVANDLTNQTFYGTKPLGIEQQTLVWAFNDSLLQNTIFKTITLINKSGKTITDFYYGIWSDIDVINNREFAAFDTLTNSGFAYVDPKQIISDGSFVGGISFELDGYPFLTSFDLLESNSTTKKFDSNIAYFRGQKFSEPYNIVTYYGCLRGKYNSYNSSTLFDYSDPETGMATKKAFSGDPLTNSGFTQEKLFEYENLFAGGADSRQMRSFGPKEFKNGDTIKVSYAVRLQKGWTPLESVYNLYTQPRSHIYYDLTSRIPFVADITIDSSRRELTIRIGDDNAISIKAILRKKNSDGELSEEIILNDNGTNGDTVSGDKIFSVTYPFQVFDGKVSVDLEVNDGEKTVLIKNWIMRVQMYFPGITASLSIKEENLLKNNQIETSERVKFTPTLQANPNLGLVDFKMSRGNYSVSSMNAEYSKNKVEINAGTVLLESVGSIYLDVPFEPFFPNMNHSTGKLFDNYFNGFLKTSNNTVIPLKFNYSIYQFPYPVRDYLITKTKGDPNTGLFAIRAAGNIFKDKIYKVKIISADTLRSYDSYTAKIFNYGFTNYRITIVDGETNISIVEDLSFPKLGSFDLPSLDNVILSAGTAGRIGMFVTEKSKHLNMQFTYYPYQNLIANEGYSGLSTFHSGLSSDRFTGFIHTKVKLKIEFTALNSQKVYVLIRGLNNGENFEYTRIEDQPFRVWNVTDDKKPVQINAMIRSEYYGERPIPNRITWNSRNFIYLYNTPYQSDDMDQNKDLKNTITIVNPYPEKSNEPLYQPGDYLLIKYQPPVRPDDEFIFNPARMGLNQPDTEPSVNDQFELYQNFPNPFNTSTVSQFYVPSHGEIIINIYNLMGQIIFSQRKSMQHKGRYSFFWEARNNYGQSVASGIYFMQVRFGESVKTQKMLLLK